MDTTKKVAVLFYRDGGVKFTNKVIQQGTHTYVEAMWKVAKDFSENESVAYNEKFFTFRGTVINYAIYEEDV